MTEEGLRRPLVWLRFRPSGYVHAFDDTGPALQYGPRTALCDAIGQHGTTDEYPPRAKTCGPCVVKVGPRPTS